MSKRYTHEVVYTCDGCGATQLGYDYEVPEGWRAEHGNLVTHEYCPACPPESEVVVVPPEESR